MAYDFIRPINETVDTLTVEPLVSPARLRDILRDIIKLSWAKDKRVQLTLDTDYGECTIDIDPESTLNRFLESTEGRHILEHYKK